MNDIDFLPAWYPRMRKNRARLMLLAALAAGALLLAAAAFAGRSLLV